MSQRKKNLYGVFGVIIGICIGALWRNYRTLEIVSLCNAMNGLNQKTSSEIIGLNPLDTVTNSQNNLLFVGVMTAKEFLNGRATAVYDTWGKKVPGRIAFFSSEDSRSKSLPLIPLKGVDDRYPPQKKSFMMLYYMYEHFIDKFEWFARADDDVFIRVDKLEKFLRSVDSSKPQFIGQAGRGNSEEFGLLSLEFDENFCMGGPGVIMSRETLRRVAPHIPTCLKNLYSTHEDVELGRCVQKFAGIPCTWNYEMQAILHHNSSGVKAFSGNLKNKEVHSAITLHPVKKPAIMYRLQTYTMGLKTQELRQESLFLHRDILQMMKLLNVPILNSTKDTVKNLDDIEILGVNPNLNRYIPEKYTDVLEWEFVAKSLYSARHVNPKHKIESPIKEGLNDVIREIMEHINNFSRQRGRVIEFRELLYGYSRVNALHGQDLILDLLLVYKKYRGKKMTVPVRRHLYVQRSFTDTLIREVPDFEFQCRPLGADDSFKIADKMKRIFNSGLEKLSDTFATSKLFKFNRLTDIKKIVFLLPLAGRYETFIRFMNNFQDVLEQDSNIDLLVSLFIDNYQNSTQIIEYLDRLQRKRPLNRIKYLQLNGNFSRGIALDKAIQSNYCRDNDILFFIDVDILFTKQSIDRIRNSVYQGAQIYLPIVYSEYFHENRPKNTPSDGYFRQFGYGLVALFKSDVVQDGFNKDINGWGLEDVQFLEKLMTTASHNLSNELKLFRAPDPTLVHVYHPIVCDSNLDETQYKMCLGTKANTIGNYQILANKFFEDKSLLKNVRAANS